MIENCNSRLYVFTLLVVLLWIVMKQIELFFILNYIENLSICCIMVSSSQGASPYETSNILVIITNDCPLRHGWRRIFCIGAKLTLTVRGRKGCLYVGAQILPSSDSHFPNPFPYKAIYISIIIFLGT